MTRFHQLSRLTLISTADFPGQDWSGRRKIDSARTQLAQGDRLVHSIPAKSSSDVGGFDLEAAAFRQVLIDRLATGNSGKKIFQFVLGSVGSCRGSLPLPGPASLSRRSVFHSRKSLGGVGLLQSGAERFLDSSLVLLRSSPVRSLPNTFPLAHRRVRASRGMARSAIDNPPPIPASDSSNREPLAEYGGRVLQVSASSGIDLDCRSSPGGDRRCIGSGSVWVSARMSSRYRLASSIDRMLFWIARMAVGLSQFRELHLIGMVGEVYFVINWVGLQFPRRTQFV